MSNATTKAQREQWIARASEIIQMDADTRMTNFYEAREQLMAELNISQQSATTALAHAARRYRTKLFSPTAAAVSLGSMTSAAKQAAARANGRKGGRPRKQKGKITMEEREMLERLGSGATPDNVRKWYGGMTQQQIEASMNESWSSDDNEALAKEVYEFCNR